MTYKFASGKSRLIKSVSGDILIDGSINGSDYGFGPNLGPGANSTLTNQLGHYTKGYGATHAGRGYKTPDPGVTGVIVDEFTLTQDDIDNRYVRLSGLPDDPTDVALNILGASAQYYPDDYYVVFENLLNWAGTPLEGLIGVGDQIRVIYEGSSSEIVPAPKEPYGSYEAPISLGSGSYATSGGSGIKLEARSGTVTINGTISMNGESGDASVETGGGSGGSVWILAWNIDGTGSISVDGGTTDYAYGGGGAGGYISQWYEKGYTFSGSLSADGVEGAEDGIIFKKKIEPFFQEKFTGTIWNTKWWETLQEPVTLNNLVRFDSSQGDFRNPSVQSLFSLSGKSIITDIDYIPYGTDASVYDAYFLLYSDASNWVGLSRKHGNTFGVFSVDGIKSQTAVTVDNSSVTWRLYKDEEAFSFQYYDATSTPQTILTEFVPGLSNKRFKIRIGLNKFESADPFIDQLRLTDQDIANKYITLSARPNDSSSVSFSVIQGTPQYIGSDFVVQNERLIWDQSSVSGDGTSIPLENILVSGDIVRAEYYTDTSDNEVSFGFDTFKVFDGILFDIETSEPVLYVDASYGSDSNDGRVLTPLQNLFVATAWAKRGGTIVLYDGTHNPSEIIGKDLTIRGANGCRPLISSDNVQDTTGSGWEKNALSFESCQARIHNLTLSAPEADILANNTRNVEVFECIIRDATTGIKFLGTDSDQVIRSTVIHGVQIGVDFSSSFNPYVYSTVIYDTSEAIRCLDTSSIEISSNTLDDNIGGIILDSSSSGVVASNNITNSTYGLVISNDSSPVYSLNNNFYGTVTVYPVGTPDVDAANITSDPLYANEAGRDYSLTSGSPDIGAGTGDYDRYYLDIDRKNRASLGSIDIGAHEYIEGSHSGTWYVSSAGDDYVNFGGQQDPFRTLDKAMSVADSTISIDGGHYDSYYLGLTDQTVELNRFYVYDSFREAFVSYIKLTDSDMTRKSVGIPDFFGVDYSDIAVNPVDGPAQYLGTDFTVAKYTVLWDGLGMDGILSEGDTLRVICNLNKSPLDTITLHSHYSDINFGSAVFVSESGSDGTEITGDGTYGWGNGTLDHPYHTISRALQDTSSNIVVLSGAYPMFDGSSGKVLIPVEDRTSVPTGRYILEDYFIPRDFRAWNHVEYDAGLWDMTYSGDSTVETGSGFLEMTYDGINEARADSTFTFSGDFSIEVDFRNAIDPVFFNITNADNTATISYNDGTCSGGILLDGKNYNCTYVLPVNEITRNQYLTEYICIDSDDVRHKYTHLSMMAEDCTVVLNAIGGVAQEFGVDYTVLGEKIVWDGYAMDGEVGVGDVMRVIYRGLGLSDPVRFRMSLTNGMFEVKAYNFDSWYTINKRSFTTDGTWSAAFYMNQATSGETHGCKVGKGYAFNYSMIADSIEGTSQSRSHKIMTQRKPLILYKEGTP